jgi:hypothetical protein
MGHHVQGDPLMMLSQTVSLAPDDRAAFERELAQLDPLRSFDSDGTGGYHDARTEWAWIGWQAACCTAPCPTTCPAPQQALSPADLDLQRQAAEAFAGSTNWSPLR